MRKIRFTAKQKELRLRILEISYKRKLSHLGSCLSAVDIIYAIYRTKKPDERFVLSCGHAGVALYAVLEERGLLAPSLIDNLNIHPDRDPALDIHVSSGSLGQGLPIALGMALADRGRDVYCLISDGECPEGSIWESLKVAFEQKLSNLKIVVNANGWGAYNPVSLPLLHRRISGFGYNARATDGHNVGLLLRLLSTRAKGRPLMIFARTDVEQLTFLKGQDAHYYVMGNKDYKSAKDELK